MKSTASGRSIFRARSLMKTKAPLRTPTRTSSLPRWSRSISAASSPTRAAICCSENSTLSSAASFIGPPTSYVGIVHQLAESAPARHDVLQIVEAALHVPQGPGHGVEHFRRRKAAVESQSVDDGPGVLRGDPADVLG